VGFRASVDMKLCGSQISLEIRICVSQNQCGHEAMWVLDPVWRYEFMGFRASVDMKLCGSQIQFGDTNLWVSEPMWT